MNIDGTDVRETDMGTNTEPKNGIAVLDCETRSKREPAVLP